VTSVLPVLPVLPVVKVGRASTPWVTMLGSPSVDCSKLSSIGAISVRYGSGCFTVGIFKKSTFLASG
jgi:hypothetical protein